MTSSSSPSSSTSRSLVGKLGDFADSVTDSIKERWDDLDLEKPILVDVKGIRRAGSDCYTAAKETCELCSVTIDKAREMVDFGQDINRTLVTFRQQQEGGGGGVSADTFATIQDLIDGDKVRAAVALAADMDDLALACVEKSVSMLDAMERGVDALPDIIEHRVEDKIEAAASKGTREGDPEMPDVETDVRELTECIEQVEKVNLFTVVKSGVDAFQSLTSKGALCKTLFVAIKDFAESVLEVAEAIRNYEVGGMIGKWRNLVKDLWRCLRLSSLIKAFAMAIGKIIKFIIQLFKTASQKLGAIWGALAHAKEIMSDCIQHVMEAMRLCDDATDKSTQLIETTGEIKDHLENISSLRKSSIDSIRDLMDGDEIKLALRLANSMDDILIACIRAVITMVKKVTEGVDGLPDVIKDGFPEDAGRSGDDPDPANVARDVEELHKCRGAIDNANIVTTVRASTDGMAKVKDEVSVCRDMISTSRGFAGDCNTTIESFLGVWDLESAMDRLLQMVRLARLGEMIQQWAEEVMKVIHATIEVIKAAMEKVKNIDLIPDELEEQFGAMTDSMTNWCCAPLLKK